MDIIAIQPPAQEGRESSHQENGLDCSSSNDEQWGVGTPPATPPRQRAKSCLDPSPLMSPRHLAFARNCNLFSSKGVEQPSLPVQISEYNRKHDSWMMLELEPEQDQIYSGLLQFQYYNGNEMVTENVQVKSSDTVADLIPALKSTFLKSSDNQIVEEEGRSYVALVQGEMERELDMADKPLEIALDCSSKGLASPKFLFKSPLSEHAESPLTPHQTNKFTSYVGPLAPSGSSENDDSPRMSRHLKAFNGDSDQASMNSFGSALSLTSKSSKTKSTSSLVLKSKKKKLTHTLSNQETGRNDSESSLHDQLQLQVDSPSSRRKNGRPKSIVSNFITRSLRVRRKHKRTSTEGATNDSADYDNEQLSQDTNEDITHISGLLSPLPAERRFTLSAVLHIYYMKPKQAQLYKSVLVSEKATTRQVISQALERYSMKYCNPDDFGLYEVVGKWQEISSTIPSKLNFQSSNAYSLPRQATSSLVNRHTAVEEFVVCYSRELDAEESPYSVQHFLDTKEGYTRRFELRQRAIGEADANRKESSASASIVEGMDEPLTSNDQRSMSFAHIAAAPEGSPGIFGQTSHRKRARRNRISNTNGPIKDEPSEEITRPAMVDSPLEVKVLTEDEPVRRNSSPESRSPDQTIPPPNTASQLASRDTPFLLNIRLSNPTKEELVRFLTQDMTDIVATRSITTADPGDSSTINLYHPDFANSATLCSICQLPIAEPKCFTITAKSTVPIAINGQFIEHTSSLNHGDLISIGTRHMLLFQDFSSEPTQTSSWEPQAVDMATKLSNEGAAFRPSSQASISSSSTNGDSGGTLKIKSGAIGAGSHSRSGSEISLTIEDVDSHTVTAINIGKMSIEESTSSTIHHTTKSTKPSLKAQPKQSAHTRLIIGQITQGESPDREDLALSMPSTAEVFDEDHPPVFTSTPSKRPLKQSASVPAHKSPRKMMFSFALNEEDALLTLLVSQFTSVSIKAHLGPAYALSMCVEYSMMCYGSRATTQFVKKATSQIQTKAWDCCKKLSDWQIDPEKAKKPLSILKELFSMLESVLLLLANSLEFYHFLTSSCDSLNLLEPVYPPQSNKREQSNEDTLNNLYNVLVYTFQQAFYTVSKVLYHALPVMLNGCTEDKLRGQSDQNIVIDQAVDFMQALLDLLTRLHVHLEVTSQFYANVFFFTNAVMFNALIEQGGDLALYQHNSGQALRANLNLLEGWACQVGFRDSVLHYLAKFSGATDLLATPPDQLLKMDWCSLRKEYPMLHPAQLHFILSQYLLPVSHVPAHWTPTEEDALHAVKTGALKECFDHHPSFELPTSGYTMDLTRPPHETEQLQAYLDELRKQLKGPKRSVDIVPMAESKPVTPYMNGESDSAPAHTKPYKKRTLLINDSPIRARTNIGSNTESQEDLLEDTRNNTNAKHLDFEDNKPQTNGETETKSYIRKRGREQIVERVHSIIGPRSFKTPEKFLMEPEGDNSSWLQTNFPLDAETVTIPRGDKGFGFLMVEEKDPESPGSAMYVQEVLPGSTADKCALLKSGDRILAIDGQLLDGADYIIADKYLREAEDDVTLVILPNQRKHS